MAPTTQEQLTERIEGTVEQGQQEGIDQGDHQHQFETVMPGPEPRAFQSQFGFGKAEGHLNGIITNDKFCMSRMAELQLSWWRRPLRLR